MIAPPVRVDAFAKVTGSAQFAADFVFPGLAYASVVTSHIARGRIVRFELTCARAVDGVLGVFTHADLGNAIAHVPHLMAGGYANSSALPLGSAEIHYAGQIVALVVAQTQQAADEAAARIEIDYEVDEAALDLDDPRALTEPLAAAHEGYKDVCTGDAPAAYASAAVRIDATYRTPIQHHNPIELFSTTCVWDGPHLTVYDTSRYLGAVKHGLARQLDMDARDVRVVCPFIGGHFGSKLALAQYTAPIAWAARRLGRPVRFVATRAQCFSLANHRAMSRHRIRLGATREGRITSLLHDAEASTSRFDSFAMEGTDVTASLYGIANVQASERLVRIDSNTPGPMRAPPEVPYLFALESAIDELATKLAMDPIELRRLNDTSVDYLTGRPFVPRSLMPCFDAGAIAFDWARRRAAPTRVGDWLVGLGCASAARPAKVGPAVVRVVLSANGRVRVDTSHHEIGNGLYTILAMTAAAALAVPIERIDVRLGDTALPPAGISGGSSTTGSLVPALDRACAMLLRKMGEIGGAGIHIEDSGGVGQWMARAGIDELAATAESGAPEALDRLRHGKLALSTIDDSPRWVFGAQFAEVQVHAVTREIRVLRLLGAFAGGRIVNRTTALNQLRGGMTWGLGSALLEETVTDRASGRYLNDNLEEYLLPVAADVPQVDALFVAMPEDDALPLMGLGEIGVIGVNAAIANAIRHATEMRVRQTPIRVDALWEENENDAAPSSTSSPGSPVRDSGFIGFL
ncbi:xanthine dehydrogenase family protein molybdopterin-binding subunit (plasmid) [Paraburkholderia sp. PREW-6R]|uniref:xanthine dehydrogenase family protein molybdopterin-binding subunit n=1 Tax=Paraburkholderia sp. PREW-6R TaxID=3141544 RepID=UPI0031F4C22F